MSAPDRIPRIVIAGTHSGCGKTTVARGLMQALVERGLVVQPFKVGPDFIDPGFHTAICGRVSRNLDPFMMGEDGVRETFVRSCAGADIAVIEGVMGMFDGLDGTGFSSTAQVMELLAAPGTLVVDVKGMSRSAHALVRGYFGYNPRITLGGVIFNRVGSDRHRSLIEAGLETTALGFVRRDPRADLESRHLGLKMAHEVKDHTAVGTLVAEGCDLDGILALARSAPRVPGEDPISRPEKKEGEGRVRIGVARDEAFCFYYQDNLDSLAGAGAELVFFSPVRDRLPEVDAIYLGGGYPDSMPKRWSALPAAWTSGTGSQTASRSMPSAGACCTSVSVSGPVQKDMVQDGGGPPGHGRDDRQDPGPGLQRRDLDRGDVCSRRSPGKRSRVPLFPDTPVPRCTVLHPARPGERDIRMPGRDV